MMDLTFTNGQKVQIDNKDLSRIVMQVAEKVLAFETSDVGQLFVGKIQRTQSESFYGAST